jgi:protein-tyrosine phosphatase
VAGVGPLAHPVLGHDQARLPVRRRLVARARPRDPPGNIPGRAHRPGRDLIDLHCHALAGLDDGPATAREAVALLQAAAADGTGTIVATPHCSAYFPTTPEEIEAAAATLRDATDVELLTGAEVTHDMALRLPDETLRRLTLGDSRCLLLEAPLEPVVGPDFERCVDDLHERGYRVLLAHPERAPAFREQPARLHALVGGGALCSITAASLAGGFGDAARWFGLELLRDGLVHSVDSDAHHATLRPPGLRAGLAAAATALPELAGHADWLSTAAPAALLADEPLPAQPSRS